MSYKSGFVTIIGRPNAGKSTLLNRLLGQKIAIISAKSQTTRNCIRGIYTDDGCQIVFLDTPGIHKPHNKLGEFMMRTQREAQDGTDAIIAMISADEKLGGTDEAMLKNLKSAECPVFLAINKADAADKEQIAQLLIGLGDCNPFKEVFVISALDGTGVDALLAAVKQVIPEGVPFFPEDQLCDFPERFLVAEVIREQALNLLSDEVPHGIAVNVQKFEERPDGKTYILADILCERQSHKGIVIGKGGAMLRAIGSGARKELEELLECSIYLELFVRVQQDWRNADKSLKQLGYTQD